MSKTKVMTELVSGEGPLYGSETDIYVFTRRKKQVSFLGSLFQGTNPIYKSFIITIQSFPKGPTSSHLHTGN